MIFIRRFIIISIVTLSTVSSQFYFGRNKIQYHSFEWHVLNTEHFEIYYYKEEEDLASTGAYFAEEAYSALEKKFNFSLVEKVPLIFYSSHLHFQQTNTVPYRLPEGVGGFFEFIKGRVVIPYKGSTHQFRHVIWHELVHVFMHNKIGQILRLHNISTYRSPPLWFVEGLAEYWSAGWDTQTEMVIRDALANDYLMSLRSLDMMSSGFLLYKEGQAFLRFLSETYGPETLLLIMESIWKDSDFYRLIELVVGKSFSELNEEWEYYYKKDIYPLLKESDSPVSSSVRLTKLGINSSPVYHDSAEENVIFLTNRMGYSDIYTKNLKTKHPPILLLKGERKAELESLHLLETGLDVNNNGELVFISKSGPTDVLNILNIEKGEIVKAIRPSEIVSISSPAWDRDGTKIVFSGMNWSGDQNIYITQVDNETTYSLMNDHFSDRDPEFSPDGHTIVFSSDRNQYGEEGIFNLFFYNLEDSTIEQQTFGKFHDTSPNWSSYGNQRIVFTSDRDGTYNLWILDPASSNNEGKNSLKQLTKKMTGAMHAEWAGKDDKDILFTVFEKYQFQIHHLENVDSLYDNSSIIIEEVKKSSPWKRPTLLSEFGRKSPQYRKKFSLDIAQTAIAYDGVFGFLGGAQLSVSDLLGNEYYNILVFNTAETSSQVLDRTNIAITKVDLSRRLNLGYGLFHFAGDYFTYGQGYLFRRRFGGQLAISYPLSVFQRIETTHSLWGSKRKYYYKGDSFNAFLVSNSLSYVFDNSMWGPVGPMDGTAMRFSFGHTMHLVSSRVYNTTFLADVRKYFRTSIRTLYAFRLMTRLNSGEDLFRFFVGGSWGLRGYPRTAVAGTKFFLINNEFRFPFADQLAIRFRTFDVGISPVRGAVFFDIGNAWTNQLEDVRGSIGFGLRGRLLGGFVLRLDIGKTTDFNKLSEYLFTQFFFGWNY